VTRVPLAALLCLAISACSNGDGVESSGDKREWSILQGVELQQRGHVPSGPELKSVDGYALLSVPSLDASQRIWIMLWPTSPPFYKQMPEGNFELSRAFLLELMRNHQVSSTVYEALRSHANHEP
jgi:hypothetical protein